MRYIIFLGLLVVSLACAVPAMASLPYYNQNLGYTIWLADGWIEAPDGFLSEFSEFKDGVVAVMDGWEVGYTLGGPAQVSLLVSELHGRVVSKESIGNFNRHVIKELQRRYKNTPEWSHEKRARLTKANFISKRNMLRLEMDVADPAGRQKTSIVYIIYTSTGMLKFVGLVEPGDARGVKAIDDAVATLYLDYGLRQ